MAPIIANGIRLEYDTFGRRENPALVLLMGLGGQMIAWPEDYCRHLTGCGFFVIRHDNRDVGLSQWFDEKGIPDTNRAFAAFLEGKAVEAPYRIEDMADDTIGLLDGLGIELAHFCGLSMGGIITQMIGIRHPSRVLCLIPAATTPTPAFFAQASPEALAALVAPAPNRLEDFIENYLKTFKTISGRGFPFDEADHRRRAAAVFTRAFHPQGTARQTTAILATGDITPRLSGIRAPTLVIHGSDDPLVVPEAGKTIAANIPGAEWMMVEGMGHDLPKLGGPWDLVTNGMVKFMQRTA